MATPVRLLPLALAAACLTAGAGAQSQRSPNIVVIVADRADRYFAPLKWEKKYVW